MTELLFWLSAAAVGWEGRLNPSSAARESVSETVDARSKPASFSFFMHRLTICESRKFETSVSEASQVMSDRHRRLIVQCKVAGVDLRSSF